MIVLIAKNTPDSIRGMLKRWFIEPQPNIYVGSINRRVRKKLLEYIKRNAPCVSFLIISSDNNCQGYLIEQHGIPERTSIVKSGIWLVAEKKVTYDG